MNTQLTLFDRDFQPDTTPSFSCKIIQFPGTYMPPKKTNYRKGEEQTVFPIKDRDQLVAMASWLKTNVDRKYLLGFILGINLGLRANELLELRYSDIFFPDGSIRHIADDCTDTSDRISIFQDKVDKRRSLYLNDSCVRVIQWYFRDALVIYSDKYIFSSREGGHIEVDTLRKVLKKAAKACGIKQNIGTHTLRKTFGYFHYQSNHDIVFLQRLFGHSSALVTMRYIGIADEEEKRAYHDVSIDLLGNL